jgi:hypothetical protein
LNIEESTSGPRCAYCAKTLELGEALVVLVPNRPIRRVQYTPKGELPDGIVVHDRCYEERDLTRGE